MANEDIQEMTVEEALDIYEHSSLAIAFQTGTVANGGSVEFKSEEAITNALVAGTGAVDSFRDYILSHSKHHDEPTRGLHMAACVMLWMNRVHVYLNEYLTNGEDKYPEGPKSFINHVTAYSILTEQDWGIACEEVFASEEEA